MENNQDQKQDEFLNNSSTDPKNDLNNEQPKPKKKKKKKKNKKPKINYSQLQEKYKLHYEITEQVLQQYNLAQDNSRIINLGNWQQNKLQTFPPSQSIFKQYPNDNNLPIGQICPQPKYPERLTDEKYLKIDDLLSEKIFCLRRAAEVHRQVRRHIQSTVKPGQRLVDIVQNIESTLELIVEKEGIERGQAFPTGVSLNNCAAHYTPNYGDDTILTANDVCKIDFGVHVKGLLIDSAFTVAFDPKYQPLLDAVKDATFTGIKTAGTDVTLREVGENIQEVMESYEIELNGKTLPIMTVRNLCGHTIEKYQVHAGKSVPCVKGGPETKMEEGEIYAIETFGSTGKGHVVEDGECSHYMREYSGIRRPLKHPNSGKLLRFINDNFSTLAFCRRWLDDGGMTGHIIALNELVKVGLVEAYPPLCDVAKSYVAQYEHTILLKPSGKEIMSIGDDY